MSRKTAISWRFSDRTHGDMRDKKNRQAFIELLGFGEGVLTLGNQVHSSNAFIVEKTHAGSIIPLCDGLIQEYDNSYKFPALLGVLTADCVPVIFFDRKNCIIGVAHAGWKGVHKGIISAMIEAFFSLGSTSDSLRIVVGPHIRACCYAVSKTRKGMFNDFFGEDVIKNTSDKQYLSLSLCIQKELNKHKLLPYYIETGECTCCSNNKYYSYRKENRNLTGEQLAVVAITSLDDSKI